MRIARVFPCRTEATPDDELVYINCPPPFKETIPEIDEVHISTAFTWDKKRAEELAVHWGGLGVPVKISGPAYEKPSDGEFVPGLYIKKGYTITSRGCPNNCWYCTVGPLRELEIKDGWNVLDDNLLACSEEHFRAVIDMLKRQSHRPAFKGGLEAAILKPWQAELIKSVNPERLYCAYDTPNDYEPLVEAGKMFLNAGFTVSSHVMMCYVLIGYPGDTFEKADKRLEDTVRAGFMPFAMLYRPDDWVADDPEWAKFRWSWIRPEAVGSRMSKISREEACL